MAIICGQTADRASIVTLSNLNGVPGTAWFEAGSVSVSTIIVILATLLCLTALAALAVLRVVFQLRQKLAETERALQQQVQATQSLIDAIPFPVELRDGQGVYRMLNAACQHRLGIDITRAIGKTSLELSDHRLISLPDGTPSIQYLHQLALEAMRLDSRQRHELDYVSDDGKQRGGLLLVSPAHDASGAVNGSVSVLIDITEYRQLVRTARATEQSLREITQRIPVVVFAVRRGADRMPRLSFVAGNLRALFGLEQADLIEPTDELREWPFHDRIHVEDAPTLRRLLRHAARHSRTATLDFRAYGDEGLRWIHLTMGARRLPGQGVEWIGYFIDTTSVNAHNQVLRAARDAAERASKAKADFLATMSHEVRTPMNGVLGMLELLGRTSLDAEQQELLHTVEDSAGVLMQVLDDVLDFSKLEAGNVRLDQVPFDLRSLIDNAVGIMTGAMHGKGLRVEVGMDATLAGEFLGDSVRIRQILLNLLNNASKFTERGSITVNARVLGDDGHSQRLRLNVRDTGIGIAVDKQASLFTPFTQAESWTTRRYGGTGLGLAICRHLVQLMDGDIVLSSRLNEGTQVTVDLRLQVARREIARPAELGGRHAIVRLSSSGIAHALAEHLSALGCTVEQVPPAQPMRDGAAANLLFIASDDEAGADLMASQAIFVETDPYAARSDDKRIVLPANPLKWQTLMRVCAQALKHVAVAPVTSEHVSVRDRHGRVLVVEDHPVSRSLVRKQLEWLGWSCDVVDDGETALQALSKRDYAILLTDCQMPGMDGYALTQAWRRREAASGRGTRLPIIAMTANVLDGEAARCREAGMDDYLGKPVQLRQLEEKLLTWMPLPAGGPDPFEEVGAQDMRNEMRQLLQETGHKDLHELEHAVMTGDLRRAMQLLHRMLGALQLFADGEIITKGHALTEQLSSNEASATLHLMPGYIADLRRLLGTL